MTTLDLTLEDGTTLEIYNDNFPSSPREWCNVSTLIFFGKYSHLGDEHDFRVEDASNWEEQEAIIKSKLNVKHIQKVYGYSHGGLAISLEPFSCRWDSGVLGFAVVTAKNVTETQGGKYATKSKVENCVRQIGNEIKTLDQYANGEVYGFNIEYADGDSDSCGGFFGSDIKENGILEYIGEEYHKEILNAV
jgi:hypothetical protein